jgi:hypothetical protein
VKTAQSLMRFRDPGHPGLNSASRKPVQNAGKSIIGIATKRRATERMRDAFPFRWMTRNSGSPSTEKTKRYARNQRCPQSKFPALCGPVCIPLKNEGKKAKKLPEKLPNERALNHDWTDMTSGVQIRSGNSSLLFVPQETEFRFFSGARSPRRSPTREKAGAWPNCP